MINLTTLPNGIRIVTESMTGVKSAAIGVWVGTGSRNELPGEEGISHFIEHLMFKGTEKRTAKDLAEVLDNVGGQLNAFTGRETTCYHARVLSEHLPLAVSVLADMLLNSTFTPENMDKERGVVKEEINMYDDTPDELIHDIFLETCWNNHPMGKPILGTCESLDKIDSKLVKAYVKRQYVPSKIVIACAGDITHQQVVDLVTPYFGKMDDVKQPEKLPCPNTINETVFHHNKKSSQLHLILGTKGVSDSDENRYVMYLLNNILGGGLSSRLAQSIREERGLSYATYSYNNSFTDGAVFEVYSGTNKENYNQVLDLIHIELDNIKRDTITENEFKRAREQVRGALYMGLESVSSRMNRLGKNLITMDQIIPSEITMEKVEKVSAEDITKLANQLFNGEEIICTIGLN